MRLASNCVCAVVKLQAGSTHALQLARGRAGMSVPITATSLTPP